MPTTRLGFNPRRPRGRRRESFGSFHTLLIVSIHAAREGGDVLLRPHRGGCRVSIHAAREGGDRKTWAACPCLPSFNPRRPRGRRPALSGLGEYGCQFQSTPPARAATFHPARTPTTHKRAATSAGGGGRPRAGGGGGGAVPFPPPPRRGGGGTFHPARSRSRQKFQSTPP